MKAYGNPESGISHYEIGENFIRVKFKSNADIYRYRTPPIKRVHIEKMKKLALKGKGLATYISQHPEVRDNYLS